MDFKKNSTVLIIIMFLFCQGCARDKVLHFTTSCGLSYAAHSYYSKNSDYNNTQIETASFLTAMSFGFMKEFWDEKFDWADIWADMVGATAGRIMRVRF